MLQTTPESQMAFMSPIDSESGDGFIILNDQFGSGVLSPIQLVVVPVSGDVMSAETFTDIQRFINETIEQTIRNVISKTKASINVFLVFITSSLKKQASFFSDCLESGTIVTSTFSK